MSKVFCLKSKFVLAFDAKGKKVVTSRQLGMGCSDTKLLWKKPIDGISDNPLVETVRWSPTIGFNFSGSMVGLTQRFLINFS